jgi:hypothetical protein
VTIMVVSFSCLKESAIDVCDCKCCSAFQFLNDNFERKKKPKEDKLIIRRETVT